MFRPISTSSLLYQGDRRRMICRNFLNSRCYNQNCPRFHFRLPVVRISVPVSRQFLNSFRRMKLTRSKPTPSRSHPSKSHPSRSSPPKPTLSKSTPPKSTLSKSILSGPTLSKLTLPNSTLPNSILPNPTLPNSILSNENRFPSPQNRGPATPLTPTEVEQIGSPSHPRPTGLCLP